MLMAVVFIIIGILSRVIPHVPNFSPIIAVALFAGVYWNRKYGYMLPLAMLVISDLIIGLHSTVFFTWTAMLVIYYLGTRLQKHKTIPATIGYALFSSVFFFIYTNFGVWLTGWYPQTIQGFLQCYTLALPFFRTSLLANIAYVAVMFGAYELFLRFQLKPAPATN